MALETSTGPYIITGNLNPQQFVETDMGPSLTANGDGVPDVRRVFPTVGSAPGLSNKIYGFANHVYACTTENVPQAASATRVVVATGGVVPVGGSLLLSLVSTQGVGASPNIPIAPFGQSMVGANVVKTLALDLGFTTGNTTAGNKTVVIPAGAFRYFTANQPIIISGAGSIANTPLITFVVSFLGTNLVINDAPGQTVTGAQIGNANPQWGVGGVNSVVAWPFRPGSRFASSQMAVNDPTQGITRGLSVTSNNVGDTGYSVKITSYDIDGVPMTETIAVAANTVAYGKKAHKYIVSVALLKSGGGTLVGTVSVGTSDVYGLNIRSDFWEYMNFYVSSNFLSINTGFTAADYTLPATSTTGDVRGTIQIGTIGPLGAGAAGGPMDGTKRLALFMSLPQYNIYNSDNINFVSLYGVTQA